MKPASLSLRLAMAVAAMGAALVVVLVALAYIALNHELTATAQSDLQAKRGQLEHRLLEDQLTPRQISEQPHGLLDLVVGHYNLHLSIFEPGANGRLLLNIRGNSAQSSIKRSQQKRFDEVVDSVEHKMLVTSTTMTLASGEQVLIQLAVDRTADEALIAAYFRSTLAALPLVLLLIGAGAWWISQQGLQPLRQFREVASRVSAQDLTHRLTDDDLPRELADLALGINLMLDRLDGGVQQLSQFSDDLAHELRSPISNLMGKAQVALSRERSADAYKSALESCTEELERLSRIVTDMLFLAQVSHPTLVAQLEKLRLEDEARKVMDLFQITAEEKQIELCLSGKGVIHGDRLMVQRALSNLLSNAVRHTPRGQRVYLDIQGDSAATTLSIRNPGSGIEAAHLPHVFERFYRVDASRSRDEGGTGLGLSIVRSIMSVHSGKVTVASTPEAGTVFSLHFKQFQVATTII